MVLTLFAAEETLLFMFINVNVFLQCEYGACIYGICTHVCSGKSAHAYMRIPKEDVKCYVLSFCLILLIQVLSQNMEEDSRLLNPSDALFYSSLPT